jgi:hypothetical protein
MKEKYMANSDEDKAVAIAKEIENHISENGGVYGEWYVGITDDINERLFGYHNVKHVYIYRVAPTVEWAREIERYFIEKQHTDGGSGGGNNKSKYVYAYKIRMETKQRD